MIYKKLQIHDIDQVIEIFRHDNLKYVTGEYPGKEWIIEFVNNGHAYGLYENDIVKAAVVGENILGNGCYLWLIAVKSEDIGKGYGQILLSNFEESMKEMGKKWIFLTSFDKSENFYKRNNYISNGLIVKEFCKSF